MADVTIDERALAQFLTSPAGPVGQYLAMLGRRVNAVARNRAPVSPRGSHGQPPGYLKTRIGWQTGHDAAGLYVDIYSPARTGDGRAAPYGLFQSLTDLRGAHGGRIKTTPHLQPALRDVIEAL